MTEESALFDKFTCLTCHSLIRIAGSTGVRIKGKLEEKLQKFCSVIPVNFGKS